MPIIRRYGTDPLYIFWFCPGCGHTHTVPVALERVPGKLWGFNGNDEKPTITPSILNFYEHPDTKQRITTCHCHIRDGQIAYCDDNPHRYNGRTIPMVEIPTEDDE